MPDFDGDAAGSKVTARWPPSDVNAQRRGRVAPLHDQHHAYWCHSQAAPWSAGAAAVRVRTRLTLTCRVLRSSAHTAAVTNVAESGLNGAKRLISACAFVRVGSSSSVHDTAAVSSCGTSHQARHGDAVAAASNASRARRLIWPIPKNSQALIAIGDYAKASQVCRTGCFLEVAGVVAPVCRAPDRSRQLPNGISPHAPNPHP